MRKNPQEPFSRVTPSEARALIAGGGVLIDVREPDEFAAGHPLGARLLPLGSVYARAAELPDDADIVFICAVGSRSAVACEYAAAAGKTRLFQVEGGAEAWQSAGLPFA